MSFIRTVLGDVAAGELGACYAHEHLIIDASFVTHVEPEFLLDSVDAAAAELALLHRAGGRAVIDSMPCGCGRNVLKLAEASRRSGVHVVCPTGLHLSRYYPPGHWSQRLDANELAELFVADIEAGIDAHDYSGPDVRRTPHRAGVIKVAAGRDRLSEREAIVFAAAAVAQRRTGAPILTHTEQGTAALEQIDLLTRHGADLRHVVLSHTDRLPDAARHRDILGTGVRVEYDSAFRTPRVVLDLLTALLPEFPDQIMLGMDAARRRYWTSYGGGPGLAFLLADFRRQMRDAGIADALIDRVFVDNPASTYALMERSDT